MAPALRFFLMFLFVFSILLPMHGSPLLTGEEIRARLVLEAYRRAFPDKINGLEWEDGDWTILVGNQRFFWAHGRILPETLRGSWDAYKSYVFYVYPAAPVDPKNLSLERIGELKRQGDVEARKNGVDHHGAFRSVLYGGATRGEIERKLVKTTLFGKNITVNRDILDRIIRINAQVMGQSTKDAEISAFIKNLGTLGGYNWREIRGTQRMSYHSWGLAVDMQPKSAGGKIIYWEWERERNPDWMLVPLSRRWSPPESIIRAFEKEGFIWGGKWSFYDTMHFEYRPELHEVTKVFSAVGGIEAFSSYFR